MKQKENHFWIKLGVTGGAVVLFGLTAWFLLSHSVSIAQFFGTLLGILTPFIYGAVIAYLLTPLCNRLEAFFGRLMKKRKGPSGFLAVLMTYVIALCVVILLLLLVIPNVVQSILQIIAVLPTQAEQAAGWLHNLLEANPDLQAQWDEVFADFSGSLTSWLQTDLLGAVESLIVGLSGQLFSIVNLFKNIFLGVLISVYLLISRKTFAVQAKKLLCGIFPKKWADMIEEEVHFADRMFNGFLVGRIIDSCIVGLICFVVTMLLGFDSAVLISVIVGVTNIIPVFGPFLGAIPSALILLLENPIHCLIFLIFIVILQQVDGNIIGPRILGRTIGISSFWVLFAVLLFGGLWGLVGMVIGVPLFAVIYDIVKKLTYYGLEKHGRDELI